MALRGRAWGGGRGSVEDVGLEAVLLGYPLALHLAFSPYEVRNIHWGQEQLVRVTSTYYKAHIGKGDGGGDSRDGHEQQNLLPQCPFSAREHLHVRLGDISLVPRIHLPSWWGPSFWATSTNGVNDPIPTPSVFLDVSGVGLGRYKVATGLTSFLLWLMPSSVVEAKQLVNAR